MQFTLRDILLMFVVVAASLGLGGVWGIPLSATIISVIMFARMTGLVWVTGCLFIVTSGCLIGLLLPAVGEPRERKNKQVCARNMEEIGLAIRAYRDEHGEFPPGSIKDANGKPMHSWRVLILPYLGHKDLYNQYDFREPWNGPANIRLAEKRPDVFACPSVFHPSDPRSTSYVAVTGSGSAWAINEALREDIVNDAQNSILVVETADLAIDWLEPKDFSLAQAAAGIFNPYNEHKPSPCIVHGHPFGVHALFADGSVRFLQEDTPQDTLKALLTCDGNKQIDISTLGLPRLNIGNPWLQKRWEKMWEGRWRVPVAWAVLVATISLLLFRRSPSPNAMTQEAESPK